MIDDISKRSVRDEGARGFSFPEWALDLGMGIPAQHIWPWEIRQDSTELTDPSLYEATLLALDHQGDLRFALNLDMALGQERVLAPAAPLLLIQDLVASGDPEDCYELALLLWQVNEYYGTPERVQIHSEPKALASAMEAIRSGSLKVP